MSLNRFEQRIFDYWQGHRDERQFWQEKVRGIVKAENDDHAAAARLDGEFWRYYVERSGVVPVSFLRQGSARWSSRSWTAGAEPLAAA